MNPDQPKDGSWEFHTLTPERWADFEELFGEHGAAGGCWCMWWRLTGKEFDAQKGEGNRTAMKAIWIPAAFQVSLPTTRAIQSAGAPWRREKSSQDWNDPES